MKRFALTGALLGALAMVAAVFSASSASAAEWLCEGKVITTSCSTISENLGLLILEDMGVPAAVECPVGGTISTGAVGPGVADETKTVGFTGCKQAASAENLKGEIVGNGCESVISISALNLPWKTEGVSESAGAEKWDLLVGAGVGFLFECKTKLGTVDDQCVTKEPATALLMELKNLAAEGTEPGLVTGEFLKNPLEARQAWKCSVGGEEDGLINGEVLLAALNSSGALISLEFDTP